jgi:initiation factor 1A
MVKNTTGGTGTKGLARKHQSASNSKLVLSQDHLEQYGYVSKMFGNGMCEITTNDDQKLIGHIRGKFSGNRKRHNLLTVQSIVLVGLRDWENPIKNCDILVMYDDNQVEQLNSMPNVKIDKLIQLRIGGFSKQTSVESTVTFDYTEETVRDAVSETNVEFVMEETETVNIDDI